MTSLVIVNFESVEEKDDRADPYEPMKSNDPERSKILAKTDLI